MPQDQGLINDKRRVLTPSKSREIKFKIKSLPDPAQQVEAASHSALWHVVSTAASEKWRERGAELIPPQWHQRKLLAKLPFHTTSARYELNPTQNVMLCLITNTDAFFPTHAQPCHSWWFSVAHACVIIQTRPQQASVECGEKRGRSGEGGTRFS